MYIYIYTHIIYHIPQRSHSLFAPRLPEQPELGPPGAASLGGFRGPVGVVLTSRMQKGLRTVALGVFRIGARCGTENVVEGPGDV